MDKQIKKLEKKVDTALRSQTLSFSEGRERTILLSAIKKRKMTSLQKLKQLSIERQYLSEMMKKYADGQKLGKRISQQFSINTTKIRKELGVINSLDFSETLDFTTVCLPTSPVYLELDVSGINAEQQKAAHAFSLKTHALEEIFVCRSEMHCFQEFLLMQRQSLLDEITSDASLTRYTIGKNHYVSNQLFKIEQLWKKCQSLFQAEEVETKNFVMDIHNILQKHLVPQFDASQTLLPVSDEEISEILEDINEFENQENGQVSDEDEECYEEIVGDAENE